MEKKPANVSFLKNFHLWLYNYIPFTNRLIFVNALHIRCALYKIQNVIKNSTFDTLVSWKSSATKCLIDLSKPLNFFFTAMIQCEVGRSIIELKSHWKLMFECNSGPNSHRLRRKKVANCPERVVLIIRSLSDNRRQHRS